MDGYRACYGTKTHLEQLRRWTTTASHFCPSYYFGVFPGHLRKLSAEKETEGVSLSKRKSLLRPVSPEGKQHVDSGLPAHLRTSWFNGQK